MVIQAAAKLDIVRSRLEENFEAACRIRDKRGDIWETEHRKNNAAIASFGAIMLVVGSYAATLAGD